MPSAVTAALYDGTPETLASFARKAAHLFFHDLTLSEPLPQDAEGGSYYARHIANIEEEIRDVEAWTVAVAARKIKSIRREALASIEQCRSGNNAVLARCAEMRQRVEAWTPPTPDHEDLKQVMLEQLTALEESHGHDYDEDEREMRKFAPDPSEYKQTHLAELRNSLRNARQNYEESRQRAEKSNSWVRILETDLAQYEDDPIAVPS